MCKNRAAGDTHTEDVQAHSSFNTLLVGEVIPGELVDRCRENTHKGEQMYDNTGERGRYPEGLIQANIKNKLSQYEPNGQLNLISNEEGDV